MAEHPLQNQQVIDRLEVGPVRVEPQRAICPYRVVAQGSTSAYDLIYRYEERVFDQASAEDNDNLAAMLTAQVALNYGLFCQEIVFRGRFDEVDQRFLREMAENTACEIYVKKFLDSNPYLKKEAQNLPAVRLERYCQAELAFDPSPVSDSRASDPWAADAERIAVLSSGGKESLLSDSLLREMNLDVHPVFINESGKHWLTALNGYRFFAAHVPNTARVWTNSDRLFAWMLRHLPFIREDFGRLRADEYPIRLWTVAVFLFGALPLLRQRRIGRLVIGDEFDTTDHAEFRLSPTQSIPHYNGLFDQSRDFDRALTDYFQRKGWNVDQFSLLRPLSELLIEKVLVERYPQVQRLQTSCHSAHVPPENSTHITTTNDHESLHAVRPCGKCEKCTRVVGMLTALGADPTPCGYSQQQVDHCLTTLIDKGAMMERPALEQTAWLLSQRGLLPLGKIGNVTARQQPEIMKLRFHPQRSPADDVPDELQAPLHRILRQHALGTVHWSDGEWQTTQSP